MATKTGLVSDVEEERGWRERRGSLEEAGLTPSRLDTAAERWRSY
jgi:hypothetical protein